MSTLYKLKLYYLKPLPNYKETRAFIAKLWCMLTVATNRVKIGQSDLKALTNYKET